MIFLKVKIKEKGEWKDKYVAIPDHLYEAALQEKKKTFSLAWWCEKVRGERASAYWRLYDFIFDSLKPEMLDNSIERIHVTQITHD